MCYWAAGLRSEAAYEACAFRAARERVALKAALNLAYKTQQDLHRRVQAAESAATRRGPDSAAARAANERAIQTVREEKNRVISLYRERACFYVEMLCAAGVSDRVDGAPVEHREGRPDVLIERLIRQRDRALDSERVAVELTRVHGATVISLREALQKAYRDCEAAVIAVWAATPPRTPVKMAHLIDEIRARASKMSANTDEAP